MALDPIRELGPTSADEARATLDALLAMRDKHREDCAGCSAQQACRMATLYGKSIDRAAKLLAEYSTEGDGPLALEGGQG